MGSETPKQSTYIERDGAQHTPPFNTMCEKTRAKLEEARQRVPRYLFRAWKNTHPYLSGGFTSLNSTDAIVPLAFRAGRGHSSVYDMTKKEMLDMVLKHLAYDKDFYTGFSSWTASLTLAMKFFGNDTEDVHISIIDTHSLKQHNQIYFVPDLKLLTTSAKTKKKLNTMHHEYLAYGKVCGAAYDAVPLDQFIMAGFDLQSLPMPGVKAKKHNYSTVSENDIERARQVANRYTFRFALPVALALLSLDERSPDLFLRDDFTDFQRVISGLSNVHAPPSWSNDDTIMEDIVYFGNYQDVRQFTLLMRAVVRHRILNKGQTHISNRANANGNNEHRVSISRHATDSDVGNSKQPSARRDLAQRTQYSWFIRFEKGKAKIVQRDGKTILQDPTTKRAARVEKTSTSRKLLKAETAKLQRAMKRPDVDVDRRLDLKWEVS